MPAKHSQIRPSGWLVGLFGSLARWSIGHAWVVLALGTAITLAAATGVARLQLRTDGHALVSPNAPEVRFDNDIRARFGIEDQIVVLIDCPHPDGILNPATIQLIRELTAELAKLPGINRSNVTSLATEPTFRFRPGTLINQTLLEPPLKTKAELDQLRDDLRRIELYTGTLVSADGKSTVILVGTPAGADRARLYQQVSEIISKAGQTSGRPPDQREDISITGAPVAESLLGIHILEDLGVPKRLLGASTRAHAGPAGWRKPHTLYDVRLLIAHRLGLVPVSILVMMVIFLISFRNLVATLLPLPGVAATLLFVFGVMGWCGVPVYLTIAVMPVLLTATGVTNDIYLFSRYFTLLRENPDLDHVTLVERTFDGMARPIASTSLTTAIGFFSFGFSPIGPVSAFGICTGIGVLFGLCFSFTAVPAMLSLINPRWLPGGAASRDVSGTPAKPDRPPTPMQRIGGAIPGRLGAWFGALAGFTVERRWWMAALTVFVMALIPLGLRHLVVQDSWTDGFDPDSDFRRATQRVNDQFHGMHLLFVSLDDPLVLTGVVSSVNLSPEALILPARIVEHQSLMAGSTISLWVQDTNAPQANGLTRLSSRSEPDASLGAPQRADEGVRAPASWRSHIEMVSRSGDRYFCQIARAGTPTNFWPEFAKAGQARFEIAARTHVRPELLHQLADLVDFLRQRPQFAVGGVLGPADYVVTTRFMVRPNDPDARRFPDDPAEIKLLWDYYRLARGPHRLQQVVETNFWQSLTTVFLKDANFVDTARLMRDVRAYEREHFSSRGIKLGFAGDVALSQSLIRGIVTTQLQSLCWSLAGIYLVTSVLGGSWRWGLFCVLPSALAVLIKFAIMGWFGIPLGVATSMFAAMTLGIGVNCAIQLLEGCSQAQTAGAKPLEALTRAMSLTGPPALVNTVAVSMGFGVLMLSQVPANARLGLLVVLGLAECFVVSLLLLPALLHWWPLKQTASHLEARAK
jgi:predicted RND superfamily exporter protein